MTTHALPEVAYQQNTLFLDVEPDKSFVDFVAAAIAIASFSGCVVVAMEPEKEQSGSILLSDSANDRWRADIGVVLSSGVEELEPGDRVGLLPYDGKWFKPFRAGSFTFGGLVRMVGQSRLNPEDDPLTLWHDVIQCKFMGNEIHPIRDYVLIRRNLERRQSVIELPDELKRGDQSAEVLAVGEGVQIDILPGDEVIYWSRALITGFESSQEFGDQYKHCALIRAGDLLARIR